MTFPQLGDTPLGPPGSFEWYISIGAGIRNNYDLLIEKTGEGEGEGGGG
jgi:hypothetical protein